MLLEERTIELRFHVTTIPKDVGKISTYKKQLHLDLQSLYLALHNGVVQTFWLYNNTRIATKYSVDLEEIMALCQKDGAQVLQILNPEGELEPSQRLPIMIKFHPIESKIYSVRILSNGYVCILTLF